MRYHFYYLLLILLVLSTNISANSNNGAIEGFIFDENKIPISNVYIKVFPGNATDVTDSDGYFIIENLAGDLYQITFEHVAYQSKNISDIQVEKNQITQIDKITLNSRILTTDALSVTAGRIKRDPDEIPNSVNVVLPYLTV